jgi:hypothetical protein
MGDSGRKGDGARERRRESSPRETEVERRRGGEAVAVLRGAKGGTAPPQSDKLAPQIALPNKF